MLHPRDALALKLFRRCAIRLFVRDTGLDDTVGAISKYAHVWRRHRACLETAPTILARFAQIRGVNQRAEFNLTKQ
jgi:hypothetical protein